MMINNIQNIVEEYFLKNQEYSSFNPGFSNQETRKQKVVKVRQIVMFFCREFTGYSLENIGYQIGNKDHATVIHACKTVNNLVDTDKEYRADINSLRTILASYYNFSVSKEEIVESINMGIKQALLKRIRCQKM